MSPKGSMPAGLLPQMLSQMACPSSSGGYECTTAQNDLGGSPSAETSLVVFSMTLQAMTVSSCSRSARIPSTVPPPWANSSSSRRLRKAESDSMLAPMVASSGLVMSSQPVMSVSRTVSVSALASTGPGSVASNCTSSSTSTPPVALTMGSALVNRADGLPSTEAMASPTPMVVAGCSVTVHSTTLSLASSRVEPVSAYKPFCDAPWALSGSCESLTASPSSHTAAISEATMPLSWPMSPNCDVSRPGSMLSRCFWTMPASISSRVLATNPSGVRPQTITHLRSMYSR